MNRLSMAEEKDHGWNGNGQRLDGIAAARIAPDDEVRWERDAACLKILLPIGLPGFVKMISLRCRRSDIDISGKRRQRHLLVPGF